MESLELELLTPENCKKRRDDSVARVSVTKSGRIAINKAAAAKIRFMVGTKLAIGNDPKSKEDFYIVNVGPAGVGFQFTVDKHGYLITHNAELAKRIRKNVAEKEEGILRFTLGAEVKAGTQSAFCMLYKPGV